MELGSQAWENGRLVELDANGENLSGTLPDSVGEVDRLRVLSLLTNNLSGTIPESIGQLTQLTNLNLGNNALQLPSPNHSFL